MTVLDFLSTLSTLDTQVTIVDNGTELITLKASGYECLDDILEQRVISSWSLDGPRVKIKLVPDTTETTE